VFLEAARQFSRSRTEADFLQWLFTRAHAVLADHWRRYYRSEAIVHLNGTGKGGLPEEPGQAVPSSDSETLVQQVLEALPEPDRRVLELRFLQGYSIQETARELAMTPEHVNVTQQRALARATRAAEGVI
jgi:RNA polymerase sigma-70 factor (ECF subfamily)